MQIWNLHTNKREIIKNQSRDTVLFTLPLGIPSYFFQPKDKNVIVFDDNTIEFVFESFKSSVAIFSIPNKEAYSFFFNSSGTTKSPHVVENSSLLFYNICKAIKTYKPMNDYLGRYENFLLCCPLNHSFGFSSLIEMLIYGVHICFPESFFILDIIKEYHVAKITKSTAS